MKLLYPFWYNVTNDKWEDVLVMTSPELKTDISRIPAELLKSNQLKNFYDSRRNQMPDYSAWLNLEVGIAKAYEEDPEDPAPLEHLNRAYRLFGEILSNGDEGNHLKPFILAQLAHVARPVFEAKLAKEQIGWDTVAEVHCGHLTVAKSLAERFKHRPDSPDVQSMFTTVIGMAVLSDLRDPHWLPQLSSSRERLAYSFAHLTPFPDQEPRVTQPLKFISQRNQRNHIQGVIQIDIGSIAAHNLSYEPLPGGKYSSSVRREGLLETLDILDAQERNGVHDPLIRNISTQVWTTIHALELENTLA